MFVFLSKNIVLSEAHSDYFVTFFLPAALFCCCFLRILLRERNTQLYNRNNAATNERCTLRLKNTSEHILTGFWALTKVIFPSPLNFCIALSLKSVIQWLLRTSKQLNTQKQKTINCYMSFAFRRTSI